MTTSSALPETTRIHLPSIGRIIGGVVARTHDNGDVTILWAGMAKRGRPVPLAEILEIERGEAAQ